VTLALCGLHPHGFRKHLAAVLAAREMLGDHRALLLTKSAVNKCRDELIVQTLARHVSKRLWHNTPGPVIA